MDKKKAALALYPILASGITRKQKEAATDIFIDLEEGELEDVFEKQITLDEMKEIASKLKSKEKKESYDFSKIIADIETLSLSQVKAFKEYALALEIKKEDTGFTFDLFNDDEILEYEYQKILTNYSIIASAVGFIPFLPISDFFILTPLQIGMIARISNLYDFKIDAENLLKMIAGVLGAGFIFRSITQIINRFVPVIGWAINASIGFAGTYAIGIIAKRYIDLKGDLSGENIKTLWEESFEEGKKEFSKLKDFIFIKKDEVLEYFKNYNKKNEADIKSDKSTEEDSKENEEEEIYNYSPQEEEKKTERKKRPRKKTKDNPDDNDIFN